MTEELKSHLNVKVATVTKHDTTMTSLHIAMKDGNQILAYLDQEHRAISMVTSWGRFGFWWGGSYEPFIPTFAKDFLSYNNDYITEKLFYDRQDGDCVSQETLDEITSRLRDHLPQDYFDVRYTDVEDMCSEVDNMDTAAQVYEFLSNLPECVTVVDIFVNIKMTKSPKYIAVRDTILPAIKGVLTDSLQQPDCKVYQFQA